MRRLAIAMMGACTGTFAHAQAVYDNITEQVGAFQGVTNFDPTLAIVDDLRTVGGGELDQLTFTYGFTGFGGPSQINLDLAITLLLDDGDGVFDPQGDASLFSGRVSGLTALNGETMVHTLDLPGGIVVPQGGTIWFGTAYATDTNSFVNIGQGLFNDYTVGGSDRLVYLHDLASGITSGFEQFDGGGLGAVLTVVPTPASAVVLGGGLCVLRRRR